MIKLLAIDFIRRNTEYMRILKGMFERNLEILRASQLVEDENTQLKKQIESLQRQLLICKQSHG